MEDDLERLREQERLLILCSRYKADLHIPTMRIQYCWGVCAMERYEDDVEDREPGLTGRGWIFGLLLGGLFWVLLITCWRWIV